MEAQQREAALKRDLILGTDYTEEVTVDEKRDVQAKMGFVADINCPYTKSTAPNGVALVSDGQ